ncbi:MAG TPA: DUF4974 domain-containing protein [Tepidisphaeraceae bacterium]|jgi:hypothetical protein|nr:DUF4974 domain-containing protein [Tepidisphaeraceae bacterium]
MIRTFVIVLGICVMARIAPAQDSSALINKALDEQLKMKLDTTLKGAMDKISEQSGVKIKEDPIIWDLLPWGRDTAVKATFENVTLREALEVITRKLGLTMVLREQAVEIGPMPALKRLGQRSGRDELRALDLLASKQLGLETDHPTIKRLLEAIDLKLAAEKDVQMAIENRIGDAVSQERTVFVPRNATLMDALESLPKETRATWYPWGKTIVVASKDEPTRRMLSKPLTIRPGERGMDITTVLTELATRTGVSFEIQPGALAAIPVDARTVRGVMDNAPAQQILEAIAGATGLQYAIADDKVIISSASGEPNRREPNIGFIQLDIGMQVLVPMSQVPADLKEFIRYRTQRELARMRKMMEEEGFKPTTQPAAIGQPPANR